jgi:hypothetical protein
MDNIVLFVVIYAIILWWAFSGGRKEHATNTNKIPKYKVLANDKSQTKCPIGYIPATRKQCGLIKSNGSNTNIVVYGDKSTAVKSGCFISPWNGNYYYGNPNNTGNRGKSVCVRLDSADISDKSLGDYRIKADSKEDKKKLDTYSLTRMGKVKSCPKGHYVCGVGVSGVNFDRTKYSDLPINSLVSGVSMKCCKV